MGSRDQPTPMGMPRTRSKVSRDSCTGPSYDPLSHAPTRRRALLRGPCGFSSRGTLRRWLPVRDRLLALALRLVHVPPGLGGAITGGLADLLLDLALHLVELAFDLVVQRHCCLLSPSGVVVVAVPPHAFSRFSPGSTRWRPAAFVPKRRP